MGGMGGVGGIMALCTSIRNRGDQRVGIGRERRLFKVLDILEYPNIHQRSGRLSQCFPVCGCRMAGHRLCRLPPGSGSPQRPLVSLELLSFNEEPLQVPR